MKEINGAHDAKLVMEQLGQRENSARTINPKGLQKMSPLGEAIRSERIWGI